MKIYILSGLIFMISLISNANIVMPAVMVNHFSNCSQSELSKELIYDNQYVAEYINQAVRAIDMQTPNNQQERVTLWFMGILLSYRNRKFQNMTEHLVELINRSSNPFVLAANEQHLRNCLESEECLPELPNELEETIFSLEKSIIRFPQDLRLLEGYVHAIDANLKNCLE